MVETQDQCELSKATALQYVVDIDIEATLHLSL